MEKIYGVTKALFLSSSDTFVATLELSDSQEFTDFELALDTIRRGEKDLVWAGQYENGVFKAKWAFKMVDGEIKGRVLV